MAFDVLHWPPGCTGQYVIKVYQTRKQRFNWNWDWRLVLFEELWIGNFFWKIITFVKKKSCNSFTYIGVQSIFNLSVTYYNFIASVRCLVFVLPECVHLFNPTDVLKNSIILQKTDLKQKHIHIIVQRTYYHIFRQHKIR